MIENHLRQTALASLTPAKRLKFQDGQLDRGILIKECFSKSQLIFRATMPNKTISSTFKKIIGLSLPNGPYSQNDKLGDLSVLWLGPKEWLILSRTKEFDVIAEPLDTALKTQHFSIVNVSDSRTILEISGKNALELIMKGSTIDTNISSLKTDAVASTLLANTPVILQRVSDDHSEGAFKILVSRSYVYHLWSWIEDASEEYLVTR